MATTITAGNATNGAAVSSDNTGTLQIKTGTGAGTTAISIDASQNVAIPGTLTIGGFPAGGNYALQQYVAPATWTKPAGLKAIKVTVVGGGGNGGNSGTATPTSQAGAGGGGGGGGAAIYYAPAPSIPGPVAITAGAGTNSFGAFASATAGSAGPAGSIPATPASSGGSGGSGSGGTLNFVGVSGTGASQVGNPNGGGQNGTSAIYAGTQLGPSTTNAAGISPTIYGTGGTGAPYRTTPGASSGGTGAPGVVIVEEFY